MKLLIDTHALLWWVNADERLPARARREIGRPRNDVLVSAVTAWEFAVKDSLRFGLGVPVERFIPEQLALNGFEALPVSITHALAVAKLPSHHHDPFDRLLLAQAVAENLTIVTGDKKFKPYPVRLLWD